MIKLKDMILEIGLDLPGYVEVDKGKYIINKLDALEIENYIRKKLLKNDVDRYNEEVKSVNYKFANVGPNLWPSVSLNDVQSWLRKTYHTTRKVVSKRDITPSTPTYTKRTMLQFQSSEPKTRRPWFYYKVYKDDNGDIRIDFSETTFGVNNKYYFHYS